MTFWIIYHFYQIMKKSFIAIQITREPENWFKLVLLSVKPVKGIDEQKEKASEFYWCKLSLRCALPFLILEISIILSDIF